MVCLVVIAARRKDTEGRAVRFASDRISATDLTSVSHFGPEDTFDGDYGRLHAAVHSAVRLVGGVPSPLGPDVQLSRAAELQRLGMGSRNDRKNVSDDAAKLSVPHDG